MTLNFTNCVDVTEDTILENYEDASIMPLLGELDNFIIENEVIFNIYNNTRQIKKKLQ